MGGPRGGLVPAMLVYLCAWGEVAGRGVKVWDFKKKRKERRLRGLGGVKEYSRELCCKRGYVIGSDYEIFLASLRTKKKGRGAKVSVMVARRHLGMRVQKTRKMGET